MNNTTPLRSEGQFVRTDSGAYVSRHAYVSGDVELGEQTSVWPGAVIRGDEGTIRIGPRCNIQDGALIHTDIDCDMEIGEGCAVAHGAILHGAKVGAGCLIGMGAILLTGSVVEPGAVVAAGAVVREGKTVEANMLYAGVPAKPVRPVGEGERAFLARNVPHYIEQAQRYL